MKQLLDHRLFDEYAYAIVDWAVAPYLPPALPLIELVPAGLEGQTHWLPRLLFLQKLSVTQRDALFEATVGAASQGQVPAIAYFMHSTVAPEMAVQDLKGRLIFHQSGEGKFLLRYHDPRVWAQLLWIFNVEQLAHWMGRIEQVSFWLLDQWHFTERPLRAPHRFQRSPLDAETFARLARVGAINEVLSQLDPCTTLAEHQAQSRCIDTLLQRAERQYAFEDEKDRVVFAWHGMQIGPEFDRHPRIANLIQTLANRKSTYRDASALLSLQDWQRIDHDLRAQQLLRAEQEITERKS